MLSSGVVSELRFVTFHLDGEDENGSHLTLTDQHLRRRPVLGLIGSEVMAHGLEDFDHTRHDFQRLLGAVHLDSRGFVVVELEIVELDGALLRLADDHEVLLAVSALGPEDPQGGTRTLLGELAILEDSVVDGKLLIREARNRHGSGKRC